MSGWKERVSAIKVGDTVGYSKAFLQSTGQIAGDTPFARGTVVALHPLGTETMLAEIDWHGAEQPRKVNVYNLSTQRQISLGD
jgi:hypothetical protein